MPRDPHAIFESARARWRELLQKTLVAREPIDEGNVFAIEDELSRAEVALAKKTLAEVGPPRYEPDDYPFVRQWGTTCMSTSLANGMITLGEPCFAASDLATTEARVHAFAEDVVNNTSSMGKPGEYRSVDDLFKYLESGRLAELALEGGRFKHDYRVRLTNSLLDTCEALWTGKGRLLVQRSAHARLAFALERDEEGAFLVCVRDPMVGTGPGYERITLEALREEFLWSPLKKIPRLMGPGLFESLSAEELLGHLERYDGMDNLGVDCPSALLYRLADAPPRATRPEDPDDRVMV